jgi:hypothetical protein
MLVLDLLLEQSSAHASISDRWRDAGVKLSTSPPGTFSLRPRPVRTAARLALVLPQFVDRAGDFDSLGGKRRPPGCELHLT